MLVGLSQNRLQCKRSLLGAVRKYYFFEVGIYEKNIEIKSSAFNDISDYGSVDPTSIIGAKKTNPLPARQPSVQEVII